MEFPVDRDAPHPAVVVRGLAEARAALAPGRPVTLLSAPGAALHAGCGWWRALVLAAREAHPDVPCLDILDCADATGMALAALRIGVSRLVLWPSAPGRDAAVAIAAAQGGFVLAAPPPLRPGGPPRRPACPPAAPEPAGSGRATGGTAARSGRCRRAVNGDKRRRPG